MSLEQQRDAFDLPEEIIYLNCSSQSPSLKSSHAAGQKALMRKHHPWLPDRHAIKSEMDTARELFGNIIGSQADNIALVGATSYGAAIAANALSLTPGQNIVVIEDQFPSNYYVWKNLAQDNNASLKIVARPSDNNWTDAILDAINADTAVVALAHCHWSDGTFIDLEKIAPKIHLVGAAFVIDATQSLGVKPLDVKKLDPDFLMCSGYKWLLSPNSCGFLYVADRWLSGQPFELNLETRIHAIPMEYSLDHQSKLKSNATRFDHGGANNVICQPIINIALQQIIDWGPENIHEYLVGLIDKTAKMATARGYGVPAKQFRIGHFIGIQPAKKFEIGLAKQVMDKNVHISLRLGKIRISPYLFNGESDIEKLFEVLDEFDLC